MAGETIRRGHEYDVLPTVEWEVASTRTVQYSQTLRPPIVCATRRVYDQYC